MATGDVMSAEASEFLTRTKCRVLEKPFELKDLGARADLILAEQRAAGGA